MTDLILPVVIFILLIAFDLVSITARTSFLLSTHARLLALREQMGDKVNTTVALLASLPRIISGLNLTLGMTRFLLAGSVVWVVFLLSFTSPWLLALAALLVSALLIFWFEWAIEKVISRAPEVTAVRLTLYVRVVMVLSSILLAPLALSSEVHRLAEASGSVTEDELKTLVDAGQEEGVFEQGERQMIYSIFQLGDTLAREIMVPRIDMLALDLNTTLIEAVDALLQSGHSRIPVYEETVDNMSGLLYAKDLLRVWREEDKPTSLRDLLRPAYFVPEAKKVDELLAEMQTQRIHMAIIVDEYGGVAGLVTLEDIVEEILGEIQDEYDQGEESPYQKLEDGSYVFVGRITLDDFNEIMGSDLPSDEADTLGGYIYSRLGRVPAAGEKVLKDKLLLIVEQVSARRIRKVSARWLPTSA